MEQCPKEASKYLLTFTLCYIRRQKMHCCAYCSNHVYYWTTIDWYRVWE